MLQDTSIYSLERLNIYIIVNTISSSNEPCLFLQFSRTTKKIV